MEIAPLSVRHTNICAMLFSEIRPNSLWRICKFDICKINTKCARNSFFIKSSFNMNTVYKLILGLVNSFSNVISSLLNSIIIYLGNFCYYLHFPSLVNSTQFSLWLPCIVFNKIYLSIYLSIKMKHTIYLSIYHMYV